MKKRAAMKDGTIAPLTRRHKSLNCWQSGSQFQFEFPLRAMYTVAVAAVGVVH